MQQQHSLTFQSQTLFEAISKQQLVAMFDLIPDTLFWIKDTQSRMVHINAALQKHLGVAGIHQVIGLNDYDFAPKYIAKQFITDDKRVMTGKVIDNRLEINIRSDGQLAWYSTSKRPLYDDKRNIIGTYGFSRRLEQARAQTIAMDAVKAPVEYIMANYSKDFSIADLAQSAHLSVSALERRFKKYIGKTPTQFINEVRLENARRMLLETNLPIAVVASESGFADHSYFSRKFAELFADIPSVFRQNHVEHHKKSG